MMDSITWNRLILTFLSPQSQGLSQVWNTCSWKRAIQRYESKDKFLKVSRFSYRYSHIQETVRWWNNNTVDIWNQSLKSDCKERTTSWVLLFHNCCCTKYQDEVSYLVRRKPNRNEELKRQDDMINSKKFTILHWKQTLWKWCRTFTVSTK